MPTACPPPCWLMPTACPHSPPPHPARAGCHVLLQPFNPVPLCAPWGQVREEGCASGKGCSETPKGSPGSRSFHLRKSCRPCWRARASRSTQRTQDAENLGMVIPPVSALSDAGYHLCSFHRRGPFQHLECLCCSFRWLRNILLISHRLEFPGG